MSDKLSPADQAFNDVEGLLMELTCWSIEDGGLDAAEWVKLTKRIMEMVERMHRSAVQDLQPDEKQFSQQQPRSIN
jgi:hypothetical protein